MRFELVETKEITDFEKEIGHELIITERNSNLAETYYARFENSDVVSNGMLTGEYGNGNTMDEALIDYCDKISKKKLAFDAFSGGKKKRSEIIIPKLIHTKLLDK